MNPIRPFEDVEKFLIAVGQNPPENPIEGETATSELYKKLIKEEIEEFWEAEAVCDDAEMLDACFDMIWVIVGYARSRGWNMNKAWREGAQTNLSKIDPETGLVRRREDGKILKPEGWKEPDFKQFTA
jgi:predicted HAD superfamily Cof-like phosphohydrolase